MRPRSRPRPMLPRRAGPASFDEPSRAPVTRPVAPGAPILAGPAGAARRGGIAAVLVLDGRLHLLTCGHLFTGGVTAVTCREPSGDIAIMQRNYLDGPEPADAAVCALTDEGIRLLAASIDAPTWMRGFCEPVPALVGWEADFWPTHLQGAVPRTMSVRACAASTSVLFPSGPEDGFIEVEGGVIPGDSGSLLAVDNLYLALCSGHVQGAWSYFTPIATALDRVCAEHEDVALWHPEMGIMAAG